MINKFIKVLYASSLIILFDSCNSKKISDEIYLKYQNFEGGNKKGEIDTLSYSKGVTCFFEYNSDGGLAIVKSTLDSRQYGHYFKFNDLGNLDKYFYLIGDSLHNSLEIIKDKKTGKYIETGSSFVDYMENVVNSKKRKFSLIFSIYPRNNLKVLASIDGIDYKTMKLTDSQILPLIKEADIFCDSGIKKIFLKLEANGLYNEMSGLTDLRLSYDTVKLR